MIDNPVCLFFIFIPYNTLKILYSKTIIAVKMSDANPNCSFIGKCQIFVNQNSGKPFKKNGYVFILKLGVQQKS